MLKAAAAPERAKISEHVKAGRFSGYKKFVWGRAFYFGVATPRREAERLALGLVEAAHHLQQQGHTSWTQEAIDSVLGEKSEAQGPMDQAEAFPSFSVAAVRIAGPSRPQADSHRQFFSGSKNATRLDRSMPADPSMSLYLGITRYLDSLRAKMPHQLSESYFSRQQTCYEALKRIQSDMPLSGIGFDELSAMVGKFTSRPLSRLSGKPISVHTVRTQVKSIRNLFDYLADAGHWQECRRFSRIFRLKTTSLLTAKEKAEKAEKGIETFTIDELKVLWAAANDQQKLYLCMGLNCGFTAVDMATLNLASVVESGTKIKRTRNKTAVVGEWQLWPTTAKLLAARMSQTSKNPEGLALLTEQGLPLVRYAPRKQGMERLDSVRSTWLKLTTSKAIKAAKIRRLSFKHLRKTGAQMIFNLGGEARLELAQTYLAHAPRTMAEQHYLSSKDFTMLHQVMGRLWQEQLASWMVLADR